MYKFLAMLFLMTTLSFAHSGRTDSSGGHYNRRTGHYHYHNSYSKKSKIKPKSKRNYLSLFLMMGGYGLLLKKYG